MQQKQLKVLVVDDSILFRKVMIDRLSKEPNIKVVGYAFNAFDAKRKIPLLNPDVITLDVEMPGLNGIDFLKQLIPKHPIPVILVSSLNLTVFEALSAGAVDFVKKPDMSKQHAINGFFVELIRKISIASHAHVRLPSAAQNKVHISPINRNLSNILPNKLNDTVVAIGASTGGTEATLAILKELPADFPGIVITQHMPPGFTKMYAERLNRICKMQVKEAQTGDIITRGQALLAPGDMQMKVVKTGANYTVQCMHGEKVNGHQPSVDVLFHSVAEVIKQNAIGVILTGMGHDGAAGLLAMRNNGAYTIGQSKESCVVYGMPMVAYNLGGVCIQAPCEQIPNILLQKLREK